jgi:RNA polymerase sigma factor (sigma-70 family)
MRANQATSADSAQHHSQAFWTAYEDEVNRAVRIVSRRKRLSAADADDLTSEVWLKLLSSPAAYARFRGDSSVATYVVSIARRVLLDQRVKKLGKWRPTAKARLGGRAAIEFDRLVRRDGQPKAEAVETLRRKGLHLEPSEIESIVACEPRRNVEVDPGFFDGLPSTLPGPDHAFQAEADRHFASEAVIALAQALNHLSLDDRALLHRRFLKGETVATIAAGDFKLQKQLYRHIERILGRLRFLMGRAGVMPEDVKGLLVGDLTNLECGCGFKNSAPMAVYHR